jgi:methylglutaconyl-CoA hydratase
MQDTHMHTHILIHDEAHIRTITLNRPEKRNALSPELIGELHTAIRDAANSDAVRVLVLTGEGKSFCAGADLAYLQQISRNTVIENADDSRALMHMLYDLRHFPKASIAKVNGHALAGGCGLALACDIIVASNVARFGFTEVRIGFVPAIIMKIAIEKLGASRARELLLRGNQILGGEAERIGMIHHAVPSNDLNGKVHEIAQGMATNCSPESLAYTKQLLAEIETMPMLNAMEHAAMANALSRTGEDFKKGIAAFLLKKAPEW